MRLAAPQSVAGLRLGFIVDAADSDERLLVYLTSQPDVDAAVRANRG